MKNDGGITVGQQATYECNEGYNLIGEFKRICQLNSTWSGEEPVCTAKGDHRIKPFPLLITTKTSCDVLLLVLLKPFCSEQHAPILDCILRTTLILSTLFVLTNFG